jgi:hypothetical protein
MKIGIYGCSYADENSAFYPGLNLDGKPWVGYLRDKNIDVTNFSKCGSSIYWSYKNYQENHKNFDKNIFIGTFPDRITIKDPDNKNNFQFITAWHTINDNDRAYYRRKNLDKAIELYYGYIHNPEEAKDYKNLIMYNVRQTPNVLAIDVEDLFKISKIDYHFYENKEFLDPRIYTDNRFNHINDLNNKLLSEMIIQWIETDVFDLDLDKFQMPLPEDYIKYFVKVS